MNFCSVLIALHTNQVNPLQCVLIVGKYKFSGSKDAFTITNIAKKLIFIGFHTDRTRYIIIYHVEYEVMIVSLFKIWMIDKFQYFILVVFHRTLFLFNLFFKGRRGLRSALWPWALLEIIVCSFLLLLPLWRYCLAGCSILWRAQIMHT